MPPFRAGAVEALHVAPRHLGPDHLPSEQVGPLAHGVALGLVVQQVDDPFGQGGRVAERDQHAPVLGQQLLRVPVRRRDHGLARPDRVGQRAGGDLLPR